MAHKLSNIVSLRKIPSLANTIGSKLLPASSSCTQTHNAKLHSVKLQGQGYERLYEPYDYVNRSYTFFHTVYEHTTKRFDDNSKVIVVEGNIGTDRLTVAKKIAEEFDMLLIPDVTEEELFVNGNGFDVRELNKQLQKSDQFYDLEDLYTAKDPQEVYGFGRTQTMWYMKRFFRYVAALRHLFNTGQGVVLTRSLYSDRCFADALRKCKYYTKGGKEWYHKFYDRSSESVWKPHLVVYLDQSVSECQELIAKNNKPLERNSPLLTDKYLQAIEDSYKETLLPFHQKHGEVLRLNTDDLEFLDEVLYEMQLINLDPPLIGDPVKFDDWYKEKEWMWNNMRQALDNDMGFQDKFFTGMEQPIMAPELLIQDQYSYRLIVDDHITHRYTPGFMPGQQSLMQLLLGRPGKVPSPYVSRDYVPKMAQAIA